MHLSHSIPLLLLTFSTTITTTIANSVSSHQTPLNSPLSVEDDTDCHLACTDLLTTLGSSSVYYSPDDGSPPPQDFLQSLYTSQQRDVVPACIVTPASENKVSEMMKVIALHTCPFTLKSGGHALFAGASNSASGISIDLKLLKSIELINENVTRVGTGNKWIDVYSVLEPLGRTVAGGRNGDVGVGGFLLGGGISFLSRRHGWACDNILSFTTMLSNGSLAIATPSSNADLFRALRGGGSNFGIVVSFDLETYPQGEVWGGSNFYLIDPVSSPAIADQLAHPHIKSVGTLSKWKGRALQTAIRGACKQGYCVSTTSLASAFTSALSTGEDDPFAQMIFALAWTSEAYLSVTTLVHTETTLLNTSTEGKKKKKKKETPATFKGFTDLPTVYNSQRVGNLTSLFNEIKSFNQPGFRQLWGSITFRLPSADSGMTAHDLIDAIISIWVQEMEILKEIKDVIPSVVFQGICKEEIALFAKHGGNAIALSPEDGPLILFALAFAWSRAEDDAVMHSAGDAIYARTIELTTKHGLESDFVYMNYASKGQDVFAGYGKGMKDELRRVQEVYDENGVWRRLRRGYFEV